MEGGPVSKVAGGWCVVGLGALLALGGCSSEDPTTPTASSGAEASTPAATGSAPAPAPAPAPPKAGQWDPGQWEPAVQISLTRLSDAEREQWRADYLDSLTQDLDGPAPAVALERWVNPRGEHDEVMTLCMTDSGFPVEVDNGGISYPMGPPPAEQLSAWSLAWYTCNARFTPDPDYSQDWTEAQIGLVYDYWDQYFIPCMEAHGYPINRAQQPSRETYVSTFFTPQRTWWPNNYLGALAPAEQGRLEPVCPPYPPDATFFGS